jgi:hypothetical protein
LGSIELDAESVTINALLKNFRIQFAEIERIQLGWMNVRLIHHAPGVPNSVSIWGFGLPRRLREAISKHKLPIQL